MASNRLDLSHPMGGIDNFFADLKHSDLLVNQSLRTVVWTLGDAKQMGGNERQKGKGCESQ
jgi:hypothetical protein